MSPTEEAHTHNTRTRERLRLSYWCIHSAEAFDSFKGTPEHVPTHTPPHTCAHSASPAVALVRTPHSEALSADISSSVFSLCVSLSGQKRGEAGVYSWPDSVGLGWGGEGRRGVQRGEWELIEFAQPQPMGLQTILQDSHSHPHARTHTHTHACSWRAASFLALNLIRAYVYGSEHMWPPLFPHTLLSARLSSPSFLPVYQCFTPSVSRLPASLSVWLPVFFDTFHLSCHIHRCVSTFINWQTVQLCPGGVRSRSTAGKPHCKPPS